MPTNITTNESAYTASITTNKIASTAPFGSTNESTNPASIPIIMSNQHDTW
jgi:hypothetical protein